MSIKFQYIHNLQLEPWATGTTHVRRSGGKMRSGMSPNQKLVSYQNALKELIDPEDLEPLWEFDPTALKSVHFVFWRQIETWRTDKKKVQRGHVADTTNLQKASEDALQVLTGNDNLNVDIHSVFVEQDEYTTPGLFYCFESFDEANLYDHECRVRLALDLRREVEEGERNKRKLYEQGSEILNNEW